MNLKLVLTEEQIAEKHRQIRAKTEILGLCERQVANARRRRSELIEEIKELEEDILDATPLVKPEPPKPVEETIPAPDRSANIGTPTTTDVCSFPRRMSFGDQAWRASQTWNPSAESPPEEAFPGSAEFTTRTDPGTCCEQSPPCSGCPRVDQWTSEHYAG